MLSSAFGALGLDERIVTTLTQNNLTVPTPVQEQTIPLLLDGRDVIASAQTGTGKTAAFLLPALQRLANPSEAKGRGPRVLVLTPTRELAQQVAHAGETFSKGLARIKTVCIVGGVSYRIQNDLLAKPHEIMVATPGRLIDHVNAQRIDFSRLEMLVLDEADRMLDMGFSDDVLAIAGFLPKQRQTAFFTATMTQNVLGFAAELLNNPATIQVAAQTARHEQIDQMLYYVDDLGHKKRLLKHFLSTGEIKQAIIFTATKRDTEELADELSVEGYNASALHGDMPQRERTRTLTKLRRGECDVLVATDVAARGIDVAGISHVINFDLPRFAEDYVHRIGRTGRAGATGTAIALVGRDDVQPLRRIERFTQHKIDVREVAGMEARNPRPQERRAGSGGGGYGNKRPQGGSGGNWRDSKPKTHSGHTRSNFSDRHGEAPRHPHGDAPRHAAGDAPRHAPHHTTERAPFEHRQPRNPFAGDDRRQRSTAPHGDAPRAPRTQERSFNSSAPREDRQPRDNSNRNPLTHFTDMPTRSFSSPSTRAGQAPRGRPGGQRDGRRPAAGGSSFAGQRRDRNPGFRD